MSDLSISRRYAQALFSVASQDGRVSGIDADVDLVLQTLEQARPLRLLLDNPVVSTEKKQVIITRIFGGKTTKEMVTFVSFMIDKGRGSMLESTLGAYKLLRDEQEGLVRAKVVSAHAITKDEVASLKTSLEKISGKKVEMSLEQDEKLIGGIVIRLGDTVYDGSIKQRLNTLKEKMAHGTYPGVN